MGTMRGYVSLLLAVIAPRRLRGAAKSVMVIRPAPETFGWHGTLQELVTLLLASSTSRGKGALGECVSFLLAVATKRRVGGAVQAAMVKGSAPDTF